MHWFLIALSAPFIWSLVNHIDKFLLSKYLKKGGAKTLVLFSCFFSLLISPLLFILGRSVMSVHLVEGILLVSIGILTATATFIFLQALDYDETSIVVPFFQLIPVFGYIFGYLLLGEQLSTLQISASLIVLLGATVLSLEFDEDRKIKLRRRVLVLMLISTFIMALVETTFKLVTHSEGLFWVSTFWTNIGFVIFGLFLFIFSRKAREGFIDTIKTNTRRIVALNLGTEAAYVIANFLFSYATLLAPIALVLLVNTYQPVFVFIEGILITILFPKFATEKITLKHLSHKVVALLIILFGSYLVYI